MIAGVVLQQEPGNMRAPDLQKIKSPALLNLRLSLPDEMFYKDEEKGWIKFW